MKAPTLFLVTIMYALGNVSDALNIQANELQITSGEPISSASSKTTSGTFNAGLTRQTSSPAGSGISNPGRLRFKSKSLLASTGVTLAITNKAATFKTNGAADRWPESCFDQIEYIEVSGHTCEEGSIALCCAQGTECPNGGTIDTSDPDLCKDGEVCCKPTNYDADRAWDPENDFPPGYTIQAAGSKTAPRACERLLDVDTTVRPEEACETKKLFFINGDCEGLLDSMDGKTHQIVESAVKDDLMQDSDYDVATDKISRCAPINLLNHYAEDLPIKQLHYENEDKRVCYLAVGADDSKFKASVCDKLHVQSVDGDTVTFKCGVTCALTPAEGMSVFDFNYNEADGSITECHLGHGVKDLTLS